MDTKSDTEILNWKQSIRKTPDVYLGSSKDSIIASLILADKNFNCYIKKKCLYNLPILNCIREIVYNAFDNKWRDTKKDKLSTIKVEFKDKIISVWNDGKPIELIKHNFKYEDPQTNKITEINMYPPEAYFGWFLSSTNYNKKEKELKTSGKNGMGAKIVNVFSKFFLVECSDSKNQFKQLYKDCKAEQYTICPTSTTPFVKVTFELDYEYFNFFDEEIILEYLRKLLIDCSHQLKLKLWLNEEPIDMIEVNKYLKCYGIILSDPMLYFQKTINCESSTSVTKSKLEYSCIILQKQNDFKSIVFANGMFLIDEGTEIKNLRKELFDILCDRVAKHFKLANIDTKRFKDNLFIYLSIHSFDLMYSNQTKDKVTSAISYDIKITKQQFDTFLQFKFIQELEATLLKPTKKPIECKADEANLAGTSKALDCCLFITEGLSAKTFAVRGLQYLPGGRDIYGVFPIKGKFMNISKASISDILKNKEVVNLLNILNIEKDKDYTTPIHRKLLRYGRINILTDADMDGVHIKGLLLNFIYQINKSLFHLNFVQSLITPVARVFLKDKTIVNIYSMKSLQKYKNEKTKYYKGLATHSDQNKEVEDCFKNCSTTIFTLDNESEKSFSIMFDKETEERKQLIMNITEPSDMPKIITCTSFLIDHFNPEFQMEVQARNLPHFSDGLKISQRKILFTILKDTKYEIQIEQLVGKVMAMTKYHHGPDSLRESIKNLGQDFTGSNNIPLLIGIGEFGTRIENGDDSGAARYLHIRFNKFYNDFFSENDEFLNYVEDCGEKVEPECFYPPIPYCLINGCNSISSGFKPDFFPYNIVDLRETILDIVNGKEPKTLVPYFNGFLGKVEMINENKFKTIGILNINKGVYILDEIPIGTSFSDITELIKSFPDVTNLRIETTVKKIKVLFKSDATYDDLFKRLKLEKTHTIRIILFKNNKPLIYKNVTEYLKDFVKEYLIIIQKRKTCVLNSIKHKINLIDQKIRFLKDVRSETINIKETSEKIIDRLKELNYVDLNDNFSHLTNMSISTIAKDNFNNLEKQSANLNIEYNTLQSKTINEIYKDSLNL